MLGVRRTSVTLTARLLQSTGMIRYRRGLIQIVDRAALENTACECYTAVRQTIDHAFPASQPTRVPPQPYVVTYSET